MANRSRAFSTTAALLGWFALTLQLILTIQLAVDNSRSVPAALWQWIGYFTITTKYSGCPCAERVSARSARG